MDSTWTHQLRAVGLRVTRPRLSVLEVLASHPHADADAIVAAARGEHPSLSPQAVYGVLKALVDRGLARRGGLRRAEGGGRPGPAPPYRARRRAGAVRAAGRGQPPPPGLPGVRGRRRRRLRGGRGALSDPVGHRRVRRGRGRGRVLGTVSPVSRPTVSRPTAPRPTVS